MAQQPFACVFLYLSGFVAFMRFLWHFVILKSLNFSNFHKMCVECLHFSVFISIFGLNRMRFGIAVLKTVFSLDFAPTVRYLNTAKFIINL